jgi:hypothetical protein
MEQGTVPVLIPLGVVSPAPFTDGVESMEAYLTGWRSGPYEY